MTYSYFSARLFADREDAAQRLAQALSQYRGKHPLVLAIPRGAVPMGRILAQELEGELDVVLVRKLGAPFNPEFAIGAIDESGWTYLSDERAGADDAYLRDEKSAQLDIMHARRRAYTPGRGPIDPAGRVAIVVDDGLATGATMIAALHAVRARKPARLVCAVPVAARDSLRLVAPNADETVCLYQPEDFFAVSRFYASFPQVEDEQVVAALRASDEARAAHPS